MSPGRPEGRGAGRAGRRCRGMSRVVAASRDVPPGVAARRRLLLRLGGGSGVLAAGPLGAGAVAGALARVAGGPRRRLDRQRLPRHLGRLAGLLERLVERLPPRLADPLFHEADGVFGVVDDAEDVDVLAVDEVAAPELRAEPLDEAGPVGRAVEDDGERLDFQGLDEREHFEEFVERAVAAGEADEGG